MPKTQLNITANTAPQDEQPYPMLRDKAYRLLARREHSAWELRRKLQHAEYPEIVERLLADLTEQGAQSEVRFTEQLCRRRYQNGRGPVKLRYELTQHQIEKSLIERAMSDYETKWQVLAAEVRRKKFGDEAPASYRDWARQARFLQQRGFTSEQIEPYSK